MLTPKEFATRWEAEVVARTDELIRDHAKLVTAPPESLAALRIPDDARRFLVEAGLPKSAAPFLTFEEVGRGLPRLWEIYSPGQWSAKELEPMKPYLMLGSEGSGDPICLDERDWRVVMLSHEVHFRELQAFVNSNIAQLAESLLVYEITAPEARLEALRSIDPPAVEKGAFWWSEIASESGRRKPWWKFW